MHLHLSRRASAPVVRKADLAVPGHPLHVMPGLGPGHPRLRRGAKTWMAGTKPGHDELGDSRLGERSSARPMIAASRLTSPCPVTLSTSCPGFVPGIHAFDAGPRRGWPGRSPAMTNFGDSRLDKRSKMIMAELDALISPRRGCPGHDEPGDSRLDEPSKI